MLRPVLPGVLAFVCACPSDNGNPSTGLMTVPFSSSAEASNGPSDATATPTSGGPGEPTAATPGDEDADPTETGPGPGTATEPDTATGPDTEAPGCEGDCSRVDLLFVIDNSGSMAEEQTNLVAVIPHLVEQLRADGRDVNVMITTTDFGHPLCTSFYINGYAPAKGAPTTTPCTDRLGDFSTYGGQMNEPAICTNVCPNSTHASDPFVHFAGDDDNVVSAPNQTDPVVEALRCLIPQGIGGCGMESPLETMLQALDPGKDWNQGARPFLRDGSTVAIVLVGDEGDCSVSDYNYFDPAKKNDPEYNQYWEDAPGMPGVKDNPTSAVCWNSSMACTDNDQDGTYESCVTADRGVLQPVDRYTNFLGAILGESHPIVMLALTGVPIVGGLDALVHREWQQSDILPGDVKSPAQKEYEFGIAPGCSNPEVGQATPPGRIAAVCGSLDAGCCVESVCGEDMTAAVDCLIGAIALQAD
jgi:hypothetical protein